jgi:2-polyprenyl-6-methoxyphenol hydroxylase-like FAD-dependent oxidoreductase
MNNLKNRLVDVLIVGAGPAGLMMACQLAIHKVSFRIIDKKEQPSSFSGALIVHARSMEIFNQMGIAEKILQEALIANNLRMVFNGKETARISLDNIGRGLTKFPNLYLVEQSKTEQILIDFIAAKECYVERRTELISFEQDAASVTAVLKSPEGKEETLKTNYLIAADGGNSMVRQQLRINYVGKKHPVSLYIIDCKADLDLPSDEICFSFSDASTSGFFPMKYGRKRIDGIIPKELEGKPEITFNDIEKTFAKKLRMSVKLFNPDWFSVSYSYQRYAESFRQNSCFLVGDAAHTYTPVGAQGMNTGMQDAYNLAWKLAFVIQQKAKIVLLDTYSAERKNIAKKTVRSTGRFYNLVTSRNFFIRAFRLKCLPYLMKWILPLIEKQKHARQFSFKTISEIGIHYRKSPLSQHVQTGNFPSHAPRTGERLPYLVFNKNGKEINIQEKIKETNFTLLVFTKETNASKITALAEKYKNTISVETILYTSETKVLFEHFGIKDAGFYLIRPDLYIAYRSPELKFTYLNKYLEQWLLSPSSDSQHLSPVFQLLQTHPCSQQFNAPPLPNPQAITQRGFF